MHNPERFKFERRRMTKAERKREAAEGRLRVLLYGCTPLFAAVARAVARAHRLEARVTGPSCGMLAVWR